MAYKSKTNCHQVPKAGKQQHPGGAPPSSSTPAESSPNSTPSGETYRASNYDALAGRSELIKNSGKMSAHGKIPDEFEFDRGSASPEYQKNSPLNTRFDPDGKPVNNKRGGIRLGKTENSDKGNTENADKGNSCSLHLNSSSFGGYGVKVGTSGKVFNSEESGSGDQTEDSEFRYDICPMRSGSGVKLKASLLSKNRELRKEKSCNSDGNCIILRSGMLHLKNYISLKDQVKVIRKCRELGLGPGGFYLPGFEDGAKLRLRMMCLGKNWDPETSTYGDERPSDGAKPPLVPEEFRSLVKKAIGDCHFHLVNDCRQSNVERILPSMTPDICIVNFYTKTGRLGLHQDKDESQESLHTGLPVVSFSIGDSAEFLFGDERNVDKVEKITLESGDVLIFGGKARHIFHGVSTIIPDTAPNYLREETNLRSGRLNLTFREY